MYVAVTDEVGPGFCDYSFDRTHFKLFKKDGSEMMDGQYVCVTYISITIINVANSVFMYSTCICICN